MDLYTKHQQLIRWFANTSLGRDYLSGRGIDIKNEKVWKLNRNSVTLIKGVHKDTVEAQLIASVDGNFYDRKLFTALVAIDSIAPFLNSFQDTKEILLWRLGLRTDSFLPSFIKQFHFAQSTFTPNASNVDGRVGRSAGNESWANKRGNAGDIAQTASGSGPQINASADVGNPWGELFRRPEPADTSALPDTATIQNTSKFRVYVNTKTTTLASQSLALVTTTGPASLTALANGDYDVAGWGSTRQATDLTLAGITTSAFNDFTLNSTGVGNISKTGVTRLGLRIAADADNAEPSWSSGVIAGLTVDPYNGTNPMQYVIDYTTSVAHTKSLTETITITEPSFRRAMTKSSIENITITETIIKAVTRRFSDLATISDRIIARMRKTSRFTRESTQASNWEREG